MRKKIIPFVLALFMVGFVFAPAVGQAGGELDKIQQKIKELEKQRQTNQREQDKLEERLKTIRSQVNNMKEDIMSIDLRMGETEHRLQELDGQIQTTTKQAEQAAIELEAAEQRVAERDKLLKTRVRSMYMEGEVSYLEVLLGSKGLGDFLQRVFALKLIVAQDTKILEDHKRDREIIAQKKKEIDDHLVHLEGLFAEAENLKLKLAKDREKLKVVVAELRNKEDETERILEESEKEVLALNKKIEDLYREKIKFQYKGGKLAWPVPDSHRITSNFGRRVDPITGKAAGHNGLDIGAPQGTTIVAAESGLVTVAGYVRGFGNTVMIAHGSDIHTLYGHIRNGGIMVKVGQEVKRGQKIAEVGSTGRSTGPHLHFGVYKNDVAVDPLQYLK